MWFPCMSFISKGARQLIDIQHRWDLVWSYAATTHAECYAIVDAYVIYAFIRNGYLLQEAIKIDIVGH